VRFAWRTYSLLHSDVSEDDDRRTTLHRDVSGLCEAGENNPDALQRTGLVYLSRGSLPWLVPPADIRPR
jgi:hypothetical protein